MSPAIRYAASLVLALGVAGCLGQSRPARAQEAASEMNLNMRFGRVELAAERVAEPNREKFLASRKEWGQIVRIADTEMAGLKIVGEEGAEVIVKVSWYRADVGDLHQTTLKQTWKDFKGEWKLVKEEKTDGDAGLLADDSKPGSGTAAASAKTAPPKPKNARFPTIRLGQGPAEGEEEAPPQGSVNVPASQP